MTPTPNDYLRQLATFIEKADTFDALEAALKVYFREKGIFIMSWVGSPWHAVVAKNRYDPLFESQNRVEVLMYAIRYQPSQSAQEEVDTVDSEEGS